MASFTSELAACAASLRVADLPDAVRTWACLAFADTVACTIAGANEPVVATVAALLPATEGVSARIGTVGRLHALTAAQINGVAAHALDFDDCSPEMDGHPSVSLVPALLALGDQLDCSGADLLLAYVAGIEAELRVARLSNPAHVERGWHPTATIGVLGTAVACGRLLSLPAERMAVAVAIAASSAAGLRANSGTMTKPLHAGMANRNGLQAALLAQAGFAANPTTLEHGMGYFAAFNGAPPAGPSPTLADWGREYALLSPGVAIKQYPCCAFTHPAIAAAAQLSHQVAAASISEAEVSLHRARLRNIDRAQPRDGLDAKFSTQYLTACAPRSGTVGFADFEAPALADPRNRALAARVRLVPHDGADPAQGRVRVVLADDRTFEAEARVEMGRGPDDPMAAPEFRRKFDDCTRRVLPAEAGDGLFAALMTLPELASVRTLTALTQPVPGRAAASSAAHDPALLFAAR